MTPFNIALFIGTSWAFSLGMYCVGFYLGRRSME